MAIPLGWEDLSLRSRFGLLLFKPDGLRRNFSTFISMGMTHPTNKSAVLFFGKLGQVLLKNFVTAEAVETEHNFFHSRFAV